MTELAVASLVEHAEVQAYVDLFRAAPEELDARVHEFDAATLFVTPEIDTPLFNRAVGLGLGAPLTDTSVESIAAIFRASGVGNFAIQVSPLVMTDELGGWLDAERLSVRDRWSKAFRSKELEVAAQSNLRIETATRAYAREFGEVAREGFGMPPVVAPWLEASVGRPGWLHYLAWDGDTPVATAAMFIRDAVGWLGIAATLPSHRGRGAQSALIARRIQAGIALGCEWFVAETAEDLPDRPSPSYHNMMRGGFSLAYQRPNYMPRR